MKPLNHQARSAARRKFSGFLLVSILLVCLSVYLLIRVPSTFNSIPDTPPWMSGFKAKVDSVMDGQQKINILFVVDATNDMGVYYPAISKAILTFSEGQADSVKEFRYAALFYRDAAEGAFLWDHTRRRNAAEDVAGWINSVTALVRDDDDEPEAVYFGLREALKLDHLKQHETNVLIHIGDAGNHAQADNTKVDPDEIINLLVTKPSHFFAVQVRHPDSHATYDEFIPQLRDEILSPVVQQRLSQISQFSAASGAVDWKTKASETGKHYVMHQGNSCINDLFELNKGTTMAPEELTLRIQEVFDEVMATTNKKVKDLELLKTSESIDASRMDAASVISTLKNSDVPVDQLDYFTKKKEIFSGQSQEK